MLFSLIVLYIYSDRRGTKREHYYANVFCMHFFAVCSKQYINEESNCDKVSF